MKFITNLKYTLFNKEPTIKLGRWSIDYCEDKINKKIDLSNEDHCGACLKIDEQKPTEVYKMIFFEPM